jgi:hypothetical protein
MHGAHASGVVDIDVLAWPYHLALRLLIVGE